jgi:hypothetical protein
VEGLPGSCYPVVTMSTINFTWCAYRPLYLEPNMRKFHTIAIHKAADKT